ncbi:MAG: large-conductance mechanosensitive channel protein MscL [Rhodothermus sp.]|nr:large-conductance mechanosensitive channel protein MscL [Rhodothermus sp.]
MWDEFKTVVLRGRAIDMAIGIVIGIAFGTVVQSLVNDVLMPPIGLLLGGVDFSDLFIVLREGTIPGPYPTLAAAREVGTVTLNIGVFLNHVVSFIIVVFSVLLVGKGMGQLQRKQETTPPTPPAATLQEQLLKEIRDLLKTQRP